MEPEGTQRPDLLSSLVVNKLDYGNPALNKVNACVAVIFAATAEGTKVLMMRRSERDDDKWSGQIAFPGGGCEKCDSKYLNTAIREVEEEMGFKLENSEFLGYITPLETHTGLKVLPCIFWLDREVEIKPNKDEVSSYKWVLASTLLSGQNISMAKVKTRSIQMDVPSINYQGYVIWGLTYNILMALNTALNNRS